MVVVLADHQGVLTRRGQDKSELRRKQGNIILASPGHLQRIEFRPHELLNVAFVFHGEQIGR
jgi:hypothetical protein